LIAAQRESEESGLSGESEVRKVTRLIRFVALFVAVPTITIGLAFFLYTPAEHVFHMAAFLGLGAAAAVVAWMAPRMAQRLT